MRRAAILFAALIAAPAAAQEDDFDPSSVRIEDAIACKLDVQAYNRFAFWATGSDGGAEKLGWTKVDGTNPLLLEYRLARPMTAFGHSTDRIAFASTAILAVLPGVAPAAVAKELGVESIVPGAAKFLGERIVKEVSEDGFTDVVALSVSNVDSHPGATLAGCSYRVEEGGR